MCQDHLLLNLWLVCVFEGQKILPVRYSQRSHRAATLHRFRQRSRSKIILIDGLEDKGVVAEVFLAGFVRYVTSPQLTRLGQARRTYALGEELLSDRTHHSDKLKFIVL
jgi:hypothetical protein